MYATRCMRGVLFSIGTPLLLGSWDGLGRPAPLLIFRCWRVRRVMGRGTPADELKGLPRLTRAACAIG